MVAYFQRYISNWMDGTETLSDGEYRVYDVICNLIYLNDGPIKMAERGFAGRANMHVLAFRKHFEALVALGKLMVVDGKIDNHRAEKELKKIAAKRAKPPAHPRRTPGAPPTDPPLTPDEPQPDLWRTDDEPPPDASRKPLKTKGSNRSARRIEKRREEKSEEENQDVGANAPTSDAKAREPISADDGWPNDAWIQFWTIYPHKMAKGAAFKVFQRIRKSRRVAFEVLMAGVVRYVQTKPEGQDWAYPASWLNAERWDDQPASTTGGARNANTRQSSGGGFVRNRIRTAREQEEPADPEHAT